jgi:protein-tyrosine-phosphatase
MAEGMARERIKRVYPDRAGEVFASSAGVAAFDGNRVTEQAVLTMNERGIDISAHRAQSVTVDLLEGYDLVLAMEESHRLYAEARAGSVPVFLLLRLGEAAQRVLAAADDIWAIPSLAGRLARLMSVALESEKEETRDLPEFAYEVNDPIGMPVNEYVRVADTLEGPINGILRVLLA